MKDAFGNKLKVGTKVIYSTSSGSGTGYFIGTVSKLYPHTNSDKAYQPPDRVSVNVEKTTDRTKFTKDPIVYACNVVIWNDVQEI